MSTSPTVTESKIPSRRRTRPLRPGSAVAAVSQLTTGPFRKSLRAQGGPKDRPGHLPVFDCRVRLLRYLLVCSSRPCGTDPPEALLLPVFGDETFNQAGRVPCRQCRPDGVGMLLPIRRCSVCRRVPAAVPVGRAAAKLNARGCGAGGASTLTRCG